MSRLYWFLGGCLFVTTVSYATDSTNNIFSLKSLESSAIVVSGNSGKPMITIKFTGEIVYGEDYVPDEAARIFWQTIGHGAPCKNNK